MVSLGSFGKARGPKPDAEPVTFDWFGAEVLVIVEYNQVELLDLMESVGSIDENDPKAMTIVKDMLRLVIQPESFDVFWEKARENWQTIEDLVALSQTLMESSTDRPTQRPSDSSGGPLIIEGNSQVVSSSPERPGRPDLQILREDTAADRQRVMAAATG